MYKFKIIVIFCFLLGFFSVSAQTESIAVLPDTSKIFSNINDYFDSLLTTKIKEFNIPGATLAIVYEDSIIYSGGAGYANLDQQIPFTADNTLIRIASVSKLITGFAVMKAVDEGYVSLESNVNEYLKSFKIPDTFEKPITLRHLLTHSAGFDTKFIGKSIRNAEDYTSLNNFLREFLPPRILPPGEVSSYSNISNALAALVVEDATGIPFHEYVSERISEPLDMNKSGFFYDEIDTTLLSECYYYDGSKFGVHPYDFLQDYPAGQFLSTAEDMAKFIIVNMNDGIFDNNQVIAKKQFVRMHNCQFTHHPNLQDCSALAFGKGKYRGMKILNHDGGYVGVSSRLWIFPEKKIGFFLAGNVINGGLLYSITDHISNYFFGDYTEQPDSSYPLTNIPEYDKDIDRFVGHYRVTRYPHTSIAKASLLSGFFGYEMPIRKNNDGMLLMWDLSGNERRLIQTEPLYFQSIDDNYAIAFREDEQKNITHIFTNGTTAMEKIPFLFLIDVQQKIFLTCFIFFIILSIRGGIRVFSKRQHLKDLGIFTHELLTYLVSSLFPLHFLMLGLVLYVFMDTVSIYMGFAYGFPVIFHFVQIIPFLGMAFLIALLILVLRKRTETSIPFKYMIFYILTIFFGIIYVFVLDYWNFLTLG